MTNKISNKTFTLFFLISVFFEKRKKSQSSFLFCPTLIFLLFGQYFLLFLHFFYFLDTISYFFYIFLLFGNYRYVYNVHDVKNKVLTSLSTTGEHTLCLHLRYVSSFNHVLSQKWNEFFFKYYTRKLYFCFIKSS